MNGKEITECENNIIESFNNCWRALCRKYYKKPDEELRIVTNMLAEIIRNVESEIEKKRNKVNKQISIDEWLEWFEKEAID